MLKNADMPAMPLECDGFGQYAPEVHAGLTKREMFAMHFHAALLSAVDAKGQWQGSDSGAEDIAVREADALLKALEK